MAGELAIYYALALGLRVFYTTPLKVRDPLDTAKMFCSHQALLRLKRHHRVPTRSNGQPGAVKPEV